MELVAVKKCSSYNDYLVKRKLKELFQLLGGIEQFVSEGDSVLLKVNLLMGKSPEEAVTTHPLVVKNLADLLLKAGAGEVIIGDSPGSPFKKTILKNFYKQSGLTGAAEAEGVKLNYDLGHKEMSWTRGKVSRSFPVCNFVQKADVIINLPKLKTHGLTRMTGAVKNIFGVVPGLIKSEYHMNMREVSLFSDMLIDLALFIDPDLNIIDGITGMDGAGPSGGEAHDFGYLLGAESPFALDTAASYLMGIQSPDRLPMIKNAGQRGLVSRLEELKLCGDELVPDLDTEVPPGREDTNLLENRLPDIISHFVLRLLRSHPEIIKGRCVLCGACVDSCPADTIYPEEKSVKIDYEDCIRCFCCQEVCQYEAVRINRSLLGRLIYE